MNNQWKKEELAEEEASWLSLEDDYVNFELGRLSDFPHP